MPTTYQQPKTKPLASKPITPLSKPRMSSESPRGNIGDLFGWIDDVGRSVEQGVNSVILPNSPPAVRRQPTLAGRPVPTSPGLSTPYAQQPQLGLATPSAPQANPVQSQEIQAPRDLPQAGQQAPVQMAQPAYGPRATELGNLKIALNSVFDRPGRDSEYKYQPGDNPVGKYVAGLRHARDYDYELGSMQGNLGNNFDADTGYKRTGYMPNKTVGGAYGQVAGERQLTNLAARQGYQPVYEPQTPTGQQVSDPRNYSEAMSIFNPDGRFYQGALPAQVAAPGGGTRAGFLGQQPLPVDQAGVDRGAAALGALGYDRGSRGQFLRSAGNMPAGQAQAMARANEMLRSPERAAYIDKRKSDLASRRALVQQKAQEVSQARRERIAAREYIPNFEDRLAAMSPAAYQGRRAMEARMNGQYADSQANRDMRLGLADKQIEARAKETGDRNKALLDIARIENGIPLDGSQAAASQAVPATEDFIGMTPAERAERLKNYPQATRDRIEDELSRNGRFTRMFTGIDQPGQGDAVSRAMENEGFGGIFGAGGYDPLNRAIASGINVPRLANPRWSALKPDDLKDQPGDTPQQKRLKADLRARKSRSSA